jgi:hypothetical protein
MPNVDSSCRHQYSSFRPAHGSPAADPRQRADTTCNTKLGFFYFRFGAEAALGDTLPLYTALARDVFAKNVKTCTPLANEIALRSLITKRK